MMITAKTWAEKWPAVLRRTYRTMVKEDRLSDILKRLPKPKPAEAKAKPDKKTLKTLYVSRGLSIREIAAELGLHPDTVHYHLHRYGIETRTAAKRSSLRKIRIEDIRRNVREKGVRGYARELGVHENTLRNYLREAKSNRGKPTACVG